MKYTEDYCIKLLQKVLEDLDEQRGGIYFDKDTPFEAFFKKNEKDFYTGDILENSWLVYAKVPKDGWKGGNIVIHVDDNTGKAITYTNYALGGRPITLPLEINKNGKYFIPIVFE
ncbi:hypothetical protein ACSIGC_11250 [Tenacibaculum sp. ZS6-P6]|uniref:hypothetical protein n=1 Tax=Tenacibaculum sp. ZS6-P6 TaxID=3447503 RepID=UPI003F9C7627